MTACRYTSCVLADSPASFMSSIIRVRIADIVCSFVIDGTTRLDADDSLTSYSSGDAATPPRLRHRRSRPFNRWLLIAPLPWLRWMPAFASMTSGYADVER